MSWAETTIGDMATVVGGGTPSTRVATYWGGSVPWFTPAEIPESGAGVVTTSERSITETGLAKSAAKLLPSGAVLVTSRASIGNCAIAGVPVTTNQGFTSLVPKDARSTRFLYYWVQQNRARFLSRAAGSTFLEISSSKVRDIEIAAPTPTEQAAVGEAIAAADDLVSGLERMIAKKQAIKQGMMQQLLTGKTRLPGFSAAWRELTAGDLGSFKGGSGFPLRYQGATSGAYPFYKVSDMNNRGNERLMRRANHYISETQRKQMGAVLIPKDAIVFAKVGAAIFQERKRVLTQPSCIDNNMAAFVLDESLADVRFVHYALSNFMMGSLVATTALPSLNGGQLRSIPLSIPATVDEQRAIAAVLHDVDDEVDLLKIRLGKARSVKQGMMQELLTGRTRLPVAEGAA